MTWISWRVNIFLSLIFRPKFDCNAAAKHRKSNHYLNIACKNHNMERHMGKKNPFSLYLLLGEKTEALPMKGNVFQRGLKLSSWEGMASIRRRDEPCHIVRRLLAALPVMPTWTPSPPPGHRPNPQPPNLCILPKHSHYKDGLLVSSLLWVRN